MSDGGINWKLSMSNSKREITVEENSKSNLKNVLRNRLLKSGFICSIGLNLGQEFSVKKSNAASG